MKERGKQEGERAKRCGSWQWKMSQEIYHGEPERRQTFACRVLLYSEFLLMLLRGQSRTTCIVSVEGEGD